MSIHPLDPSSIHRITSGQVVIDLQTAVKELVENSLDAGATNIDLRFKEYGLNSIQVIDNGSGIAPHDYHHIALKHHTSKLATFLDLSTVITFGFRGEALSSLCALSESVAVVTSTANQAGLGGRIELDTTGHVVAVNNIARQRGTTVTITNLFKPLPVRRKELERNVKREFGKALALLNAFALVPCVASSNTVGDSVVEKKGVRLTVSNQTQEGRKTTHIAIQPSPSLRSSVSSLWGPKAIDHLVDLDITFSFPLQTRPRATVTDGDEDEGAGVVHAKMRGLISKFDLGCGRTGSDRQFFYVNGRPWNGSKIQKIFNDVYHSFNVNQAPFIIADLLIPTAACDINVSPDKRTIFLHGESNLFAALKTALEDEFAPSRSTYDVGTIKGQSEGRRKQHPSTKSQDKVTGKSKNSAPLTDGDDNDDDHDGGSSGIQWLSEMENPMTSQSQSQHCEPVTTPSSSPFPTSSPIPSPSTQSTSQLVPSLESSVPTLSSTPGSESYIGMESTGPPDVGMGASVTVDASANEGVSPRRIPVLGEISTTSSLPSHLAPHAWRGVGRSGSSSSKSGPGPVATAVPARKYIQTVLDTTGAVWNRGPQCREIQKAVEVEEEGEEDEPPRKKRCSNTGAAGFNAGDIGGAENDIVMENVVSEIGGEGEAVIGRSGGNKADMSDVVRKDAPKDLRAILSGFARKNVGARTEDHEDQLQEDEEEAEERTANSKRKTQKAARDKGKEPLSKRRNPNLTVEEDEGENIEVDELVDDDDIVGDPISGDVNLVVPAGNETGKGKGQGTDKRANPTKHSSLKELTDDEPEEEEEDMLIENSNVTVSATERTTTTYEEFVTRAEIVRSADERTHVPMRFDLLKVSDIWRRVGERRGACTQDNTAEKFTSPVADRGKVFSPDEDDDEKAADALSRVIDKKDFGTMDIVGQFNRGFIIARRQKMVVAEEGNGDGGDAGGVMMDDLFIVDQHAADEKYNFETLQQTTSINSQRLLRPQPLELTAADELLAADNIDLLRQNGFEVEVIDDLDVDMGSDSGRGRRLRLVAQPVSKSTVFDMKDLEELIQLIRDRPSTAMVRCSKARAMFAMRACRKSVMVGMPLNKYQMATIVRHMGMLDQPWNCPHGRPTMRHLSDIAAVVTGGENSRGVIDWTRPMK